MRILRKRLFVTWLLGVFLSVGLMTSAFASMPTISNVTVTDVSSTGFTVIWTSDQASTSTLQVFSDAAGTTAVAGATVTPDTTGNAIGVMKVTVSGLAASTSAAVKQLYYYKTVTTSQADSQVFTSPVSSSPVTMAISGGIPPGNALLVQNVKTTGNVNPSARVLLVVTVTGGLTPVAGWTTLTTGQAQVSLDNIINPTTLDYLTIASSTALTTQAFGGLLGNSVVNNVTYTPDGDNNVIVGTAAQLIPPTTTVDPVTGVSGTAGNTQVPLTWTNPGTGNSGVIIVYGTAVLTGAPANGTTYTAGNTIGNGTVGYVGASGTTGTVTGLTNNTPYYFAVYSKNATPNYSTAATAGPYTPTATTTFTATFTVVGGTITAGTTPQTGITSGGNTTAVTVAGTAGYTFTGWTLQGSSTVITTNLTLPPQPVTSDVTYVATFTAPTVAAPVATNSSITVPTSGAKSGTLAATGGVPPYRFSIVTPPSGVKGDLLSFPNGTVVGDGSFSYASYNAGSPDTFTFRVTDNAGRSSDGTVTVTIVNTPPVIKGVMTVGNFSIIAIKGVPTTTLKLLASDKESDAITYSIATQGTKGTVAWVDVTQGTFKYTPTDAVYTGPDSFTAKVSQSSGEFTTAVVNVTINDANTPPVASNGTLIGRQDTTLSGTLKATDVDLNPLTFSLIGGGTPLTFTTLNGGTVTITSATTGAFNYLSALGWPGGAVAQTDTFTFKANDGPGGVGGADSNVATVTITVAPPTVKNTPVGANGGPYTTTVGTDYVGNLAGSDADGDRIDFKITSPPSKGTVGPTNSGQFLYQPSAAGADSFKYQVFEVNDSASASPEYTITFNNLATPVIDSISPATALPTTATTVVIAGSGFAADSQVFYATNPLASPPTLQITPVTFVSATQLTITTPSTLVAGSYYLFVKNPSNLPDSQWSLSSPVFVVAASGAPVITSIAPTVGLPTTPTTLTAINGLNFPANAEVYWNTADSTTTPVPTKVTTTLTITGTLITGATIPGQAAGTYYVFVKNPSTGVWSNSAALVVTSTLPPVISSIVPTTGVPTIATTLTAINGSNFPANAEVYWNTADSTITPVPTKVTTALTITATLITGATIPGQAAGTYYVFVKDPTNNLWSNSKTITVAAPTINSVSASTTTISINGINLPTATPQVWLNTTCIAPTTAPPVTGGKPATPLISATSSLISATLPTGGLLAGTKYCVYVWDPTTLTWVSAASATANTFTTQPAYVDPGTGTTVPGTTTTTKADFKSGDNVTQVTGAAPFTVQFTNTSTGPCLTYVWDFGDNTPTSMEKDPKHVYTQNGTYSVKLTAYCFDGTFVATKKDFVIVTGECTTTSVFTSSVASGVKPLTVNFDASGSANAASYSWSFGDNQTGTGKTASHTFATAGTFTVTLATAADAAGICPKTSTATITVTEPAPSCDVVTASFTANPMSGDKPLAVSFDASGSQNAASYSWNFGDTKTGAGKTTTNTYATAGSFTVTLTVADASGKCGKTATQTIKVTEAAVCKTSAVFTASPLTGNMPLNVQFNAAGSSNDVKTYAWNYGDGQTDTGAAVSHQYTKVGSFTATLTVTGDCSKSATQIIEVKATDRPNKPVALTPANNVTTVSLTPTLTVQSNYGSPVNAAHAKTRWQIATDKDFKNIVYDVTNAQNLTSIWVPDFMLKPNTQYYWRAQFIDNRNASSDWSDVFTFLTVPANTEDANNNGVPETQESASTDANSVCAKSPKSGVVVCVKAAPGAKPTGLKWISTTTLPAGPAGISFPSDVFTYRELVVNPGDSVTMTFTFSEALPAGAGWYKYNQIAGWVDYTPTMQISADRKVVTMTLKDGGAGDSDGIANGAIVDPVGFGVGAAPPAPTGCIDCGDSGGGGCFISAVSGGVANAAGMVMLTLSAITGVFLNRKR